MLRADEGERQKSTVTDGTVPNESLAGNTKNIRLFFPANQEQVGLEVALPEAFLVSHQSVVAVALGQWRIRYQEQGRSFIGRPQVLGMAGISLGALVIFLEGPGEFNRPHQALPSSRLGVRSTATNHNRICDAIVRFTSDIPRALAAWILRTTPKLPVTPGTLPHRGTTTRAGGGARCGNCSWWCRCCGVGYLRRWRRETDRWCHRQ